MKVIISSQYLNDMKPEERKQIDYWLLFRSLPEAKLEEVYKDTDATIPFETFLKMYKVATAEKYNFFYVDVPQDEYRRNFNKWFEGDLLEEDEDWNFMIKKIFFSYIFFRISILEV